MTGPRYHFSEDGGDSEYESEGETTYKYKQDLGHGAFASASLFASKDGKQTVILKSIFWRKWGNLSANEMQRKLNFYRTMYNAGHIFFRNNSIEDCVLEVPFFEGVRYDELDIRSFEECVYLLLSAVTALEACHNKGLCVLDLQRENIIFNPATKKSKIIDGGLSVPINSPMPEFFGPWVEIQHPPKWFAPECFNTSNFFRTCLPKKRANVTMDIYSLGFLMKSVLLKWPHSRLKELIQQCLSINPKHRPSLEIIKDQLEAILYNREPILPEEIAVDEASCPCTIL